MTSTATIESVVVDATGAEVDVERLKRIDTVYHWLQTNRGFEVKLYGLGTTKVAAHTACISYPLMPKAEFEAFCDDVEKHGVKTPIDLDDKGRVIDGRIRAAAACVTGATLRTRSFQGDAAAAAALRRTQNDHRSHYNAAQQALLVRQHYLVQASREAQKRMETGAPAEGTAVQVAVARSPYPTSARNVELLKPIDRAPGVQHLVILGEVTSVAEARRLALEEGATPAERKQAKARTQARDAQPRGHRLDFPAHVDEANAWVTALAEKVERPAHKGRRERLLREVRAMQAQLAEIEKVLA